MPAVLAHPVRLLPAGNLATVEAGTTAEHAQSLAILIASRRGERPLAPTYGITDPAFDALDAGELAAVVAVFGPPVTITEVTTTITGEGTATALVTFE